MRYAARMVAAAGMIALALAGGAGAQDKDTPKKQRPGGFGPGGFPGGPGGGGGGIQGLVRSKMVKEEIKLTEEQEEKLKEVAKSVNEKAKSIREEKLKDVEGPDRFAKMGEVMAEVNKLYAKEFATVLKPEQVTRLKQIQTQVGGAAAFRSPDVQDALKLTADQKEKIKEIGDEAGKEMRELFQDIGFKPGEAPDKDKMAELQKKMAAVQKETMTKTVAALTDDQKKTWKDLTGEPFDVKKFQEEQRGSFGPRPRPEPKKDDK